MFLAGRTLAKLDRIAEEIAAAGGVAEAAQADAHDPHAVEAHVDQVAGVIVLLSSSAARESGYEMGGFSLACAAIECLGRALAGEVGRHGVRVVDRLAEVADTAAFVVSDHAGAMTGAVVNLTCGAIVD